MPGVVDVDFEVKELEAGLEVIVRRKQNVSSDTLAQGMISAIDDLIQSEGDGKWEEMSDVTVEIHPHREGGSLLDDTGLLAQIQDESGPDWVEVYSPAPYAKFHVSKKPRKLIPLRDFLAIDLGAVLEETGDDVMQEILR